jgi:hypothetical protein
LKAVIIKMHRFEGREEISGMAIPKSSVQELATKAHEMGADVLRGPLQRLDEEGCWTIGNIHLKDWLARYESRDLILIAAVVGEGQEPAKNTCGTCGREYIGHECPYCREVRERLRGRRA